MMLKAFVRNSLLISSSNFINSDASKASLSTLAEKIVKVSKKLMSGRLLDSILDLNWMKDWFSAKAYAESEALRKMIQLYALAIFVAFSFSFFFSEGRTLGTGRPLCLASCSKTCCLFSKRKSSLQYSRRV